MPTFVDTNVLVYAHDADAGAKHEVARDCLRRLWAERDGVVSLQVLQEFYVTVTRGLPHRLPRAEARRLLQLYGRWPVVRLVAADLVGASEMEERHRLSYWDALILAAALRAGAGTLLSEDLHAGQVIAGVAVHNPFV